MALEDYLAPGEEILARAGNFYATSRRLIRYGKDLLGEDWDDIAYAHLASVSLVRKPHRGLINIGVLLLAMTAALFIILLAIATPLRTFLQVNINPGTFLPLFVVGGGLGVALILVGSLLPATYYQFRMAGMSPTLECRFRLGGVRRAEARRLVRTVREMSLGLAGSNSAGSARLPLEVKNAKGGTNEPHS